MPSEPSNPTVARMKVCQAAKLLNCSEKFVRSECAAGRMQHTRIGRLIFLTPEWVEQYRRSHTFGGSTEATE